MTRFRKLRLILFTVAILLSILACNFGQSAPTATPVTDIIVETLLPPPPTETPLPALSTDTPMHPPATGTSIPSEPDSTKLPGGDTPEPERTPGQFNILSLQGYLDDWEDWHIVGLLANDTDRVVSDLEIEIEVFDSSGSSLYKEITWSMLYNLAPGEITPFDMWLYEDLPGADHFKATVVGHGPSDIERASIDVSEITRIDDDYSSINLAGEVTNNNDTAVVINGLAAALFDQSGNLITVEDFSVIQHHLEPGESGPFRITLYLPDDQVNSLADYKLYWDPIVADPAELVDVTLTSFYDYMDSYNNFHLVGAITNNSTENMSFSLIAGIYDKNGNMLDAASLSLPVYYVAPGETIPIDFDSWGPLSYTPDAYDLADNYVVSLDYYLVYESYAELVTISTKDDSNTFSDDEAKFIGYLVNDSSKDLTGATIIAALYEKGTDNLLATGYSWVFDDLAADAESAYEVVVSLPQDLDPDTVDTMILAKGELP